MKRPAKIAIVGGGITGLACAYFLEKKLRESKQLDATIDLFEAGARLGGKIQTQQHESGVLLELGAESFLSRKPHGIQFCDELGLTSKLTGTNPDYRKTFVWRKDELFRLPEGLSGFVPGNLNALARTRLLSAFGKFRVAIEPFLPARNSDDDESIAAFISRRLGKQAYQRLVQPLLCGIYCGDGQELSILATFPELRKLEKEAGSLIRGLKNRTAAGSSQHSPFVTFRQGMAQLVDATIEQLKLTRLHASTEVGSLSPARPPGKWILETSASKPVEYDSVVLATPAFVSARLLKNLNPKLASTLYQIPHVSTATINLWYDRDSFNHPLDGYGFVIPSEEQNQMTAVTWTSSKHYHRAPADTRLIRAYLGRAGNEISAETSDQEMLDQTRAELKRTMGIQSEPAGYQIKRWYQGSPQYTLGHLDRLKQIDHHSQSHQSIFLCGCSYRGVGIPDCIRDGKQTAENVIQQLTDAK